MTRSKPNILITGTPGVGKSTLCSEVLKCVDFEWLEISKIAKSRDCLSGYDDKLQCPIIDEDKIVDELDPIVESGGKIIEYHGCDFFPERWFDMVFVVRTNNTVLYDRLKERFVSEIKIERIFRSIFLRIDRLPHLKYTSIFSEDQSRCLVCVLSFEGRLYDHESSGNHNFNLLIKGYNDLKISKNVECEIFQSILEEAMESYDSKLIQELNNNNPSDMESNIKIIVDWINKWFENSGQL